METIEVGLSERSYPIYIGTDIDCGKLVRKALGGIKDVMVVTNETVGPLYFDKLKTELEASGFKVSCCVLKDGERYKTVDSWLEILTKLLELNFSRDSAVVALGGGVVGDMAGFAAASFQRGIPYVQIPTTLLAMVDSSVGGKTAINHPLGKNMIGAFYQPKAVVADIACLKTLPKRELAAGMGEVIKTGVIYDKEFFDYLEAKAPLVFLHDHDFLVHVVKRCCQIKAEVVSFDEKEHGLRAILNFGHTFGHAVEAGLGFGVWLHGEGVGLGMAVASALALKRGYISKEDYGRIVRLIEKCDLPTAIPDSLSADDFAFYMHHDKKVRAGAIRYILPLAIGKVELFKDVGDDEVKSLIADFKAGKYGLE